MGTRYRFSRYRFSSIGKKRTPEFRHRDRIRQGGDSRYGKDADRKIGGPRYLLLIERVIYKVNSFQFTRSARLILAHPEERKRRVPPRYRLSAGLRAPFAAGQPVGPTPCRTASAEMLCHAGEAMVLWC